MEMEDGKFFQKSKYYLILIHKCAQKVLEFCKVCLRNILPSLNNLLPGTNASVEYRMRGPVAPFEFTWDNPYIGICNWMAVIRLI